MAVSLTSLGVNPDRLYHGQPVVAGGTVYTAPGVAGDRSRVQVARALICNPSAAPLTVRLGLVPQGASEDGTHYLLGDQQIPANSTLGFDLGVVMRPGDTLAAQSASLPAPSGLAVTTATTGGTLPNGVTNYYKITATNANGETAGTAEVSVTSTSGTSSNTLTWSRSLGATGYKIYRSTATGTEILLATIAGGATTTYVDTGSATTSGSAPTVGNAPGCIFTISGSELPA